MVNLHIIQLQNIKVNQTTPRLKPLGRRRAHIVIPNSEVKTIQRLDLILSPRRRSKRSEWS